MTKKLEPQHKHVMRLIDRDKGPDGWATVSNVLFPVLSKNMPTELVEFEPLESGGRARITAEGQNVMAAMQWL